MDSCCEFSRRIPIHKIQKKQVNVTIEADDKEKQALSERFDLPDIKSLSCNYQLDYVHGAQIRARGHLCAEIIQICVVSVEEFTSKIDEKFNLLFMPSHKMGSELEEIDDPDVIPYDHDYIDIGEVTSEQLALLCDPYPHKEGANNTFITKEEELKSLIPKDTKHNPFKILEQLKNEKKTNK